MRHKTVAMKHTMRRALLTSMLCMFLSACEPPVAPEIADQSVRPARVMTVSLENQNQQMELVGRVEAAQSIDLAFEVSGPLQQLPIREGQEVKKGQLLAAIDPGDFKLAVSEAMVQLRLAQQDLDRKASILSRRGIARSAVDDAQSMRDLQQVRLTQARQKLAEASLLAPFDGVIAQRFVDGFTNVNAAQPILRLHATNELYVVANVPEHLSATLTPEDIETVYSTFSFSGDEKFPLTFRENSGEADRVAQSVEVSFAMPKSKQWNFLPGMTATVTMQLKQSGIASVVLPAAAVISDPEQRLFVWLVDNNTQTVSRRYIVVSQSQHNGVVVTQGLSDGDVLVTTGAATLNEGIKVRPMLDDERV